MSFTLGPPTQANFTAYFLRGVMGIPSSVIPDDSPAITVAFNIALGIVNTDLALVGACYVPFSAQPPNPSPFYTLAVYNLAGDRLVNFAPDPTPPVYYPGAPPYVADDLGNQIPYMAYLRQQYHLAEFTPGAVASTSDEGTSGSLLNPEVLKTLSIADLQTIKTPWGRQYLSLAQSAGYGPWGLS
jgi:hypothetical protein